MGTMRDDFETAFKQAEGEDAEVEEETVTAQAQETDETSEPSEAQAETEETDETPAEQDAQPDDIEEKTLDTEASKPVKAPASWTPAAREHWKDLPADVQKQVAKRETQIMQALENGKEFRKTGERFMEVVNKYHPIIAAEGVSDPVEGFKGLLDSITGLRMGNPHQKAQIVSKMIQIYGVDVNELDNVLSGQIKGQPAQPSPNTQLEQLLDQRLAPVQQFMSTLEQQRMQARQQAEQRVYSEVDQFAQTHEFYEDVRYDMADLLDVAAQNGREMSMEQAYNAACAAHPEIAKVMQSRNYQTNVASKRNAASSISGKQSGTPVQSNDSIRDALMNAINS